MVTVAAAPVTVLDDPELRGYPRSLRPHVAVPGVYYAGFWVRVGINIVDAAIQLVLYLIVNYILQAITGIIGGIAHLSSDGVTTGTSIAAALAVAVYYNLVLVARRGATPGMRLGSLRIVGGSDITVTPSRRTLYLRGAIWLAFSVLAPLRILDALFIVFDARKRSLHDRLVDTAVVRRAPPAPKLASMLCTVCKRPVDEGTLCSKHGGSLGLTITLTGHTVSLQVAAAILAAVSVVGFIVGIVFLVTGRPLGAVAIVIAALLLRTTMALTQLRSWARWVGFGAALLLAVGCMILGASQLSTSVGAGAFLFTGAAVGLLVAACLWTPETYRSFQRIPG